MSFSQDVKTEIASEVPRSRHCQIAFLAAIYMMCGAMRRGRLIFQTERAYVARMCFTLLEKTCKIRPNVCVRHMRSDSFLIMLDGAMATQAARMLKIDGSRTAVNELLVERSCCKRSFISGAFLASGSMNDPASSYHLEFVCMDGCQAQFLVGLMESFAIEARVTFRKKYHVVYIKEGEQIVELLRVMQASHAMMEMENERIVKEMRNNVNRQVNCETANIGKTVAAAVKQVNDIKYIRDKAGFDILSEPLRQMAELRLENPEAPLKELGAMLDRPVGKSGVNHRLRRLSEIAEDLRRENL